MIHWQLIFVRRKTKFRTSEYQTYAFLSFPINTDSPSIYAVRKYNLP